MSIKITAYLKKATPVDLFNKDGVIEHLALFYKSKKDEKMYGAYYTCDDTDYFEIFVKQDIGMVYMVNFDPPNKNDIEIELDFTMAEAVDLKETPTLLKIRKIYYIKEEDDLTGPYFLSGKSDPGELKQLLDNKKLYMITSNQKITELINQKVT